MLEQLKQERNNLIIIFILLSINFYNILTSSETTKETNENDIKLKIYGHSHNDYYQSRPLFNAIDNYMKSIEIDIFMINNQFYVAHSVDEIKNERTLEKLYLNPLLEIINLNKGSIYPNQNEVFYVFIDIKKDGKKVIPLLNETINQFKSKIKNPNFNSMIKFVITGDNDYESIINTNGNLSIDGRPIDLLDDINNVIKYDNNLMPIISDDIKNWTKAKEPKELTELEIMTLKKFINDVHNQGQLVRFWGYKDDNQIWNYLINLGVDLINNDNPEQFRLFINSYQK